ncbi:MAG: DNA repair protein RadA [Bacteroidales bacterium]|nr:DNA repair protein RadA [Bacteroidales bacterium]
MAKEKSVYVCSNCSYQSSAYIGKCPQCGAWGSFEQKTFNAQPQVKHAHSAGQALVQPITQIMYNDTQRLNLKDTELNRVLGGGLVTGSVVLIGGEPGIGKSTLLLQIALMCSECKVLYVSAEESAQQIKLRQMRMNISSDNCLIMSTDSAEQIVQTACLEKPQLLIVDSVQTITTSQSDSFAGSITQVRACADILTEYAKTNNVPVILVGHITKDGMIAGPKILEHMVDTVLQFEGDKNYGYRILRSVKNRFGATNELGIYEMTSYGLQGVENPSKVLLSGREEHLSGVAICAATEGRRTLLTETQALVSPSYYSSPQRISNGFDIRRLNVLLAVLEKKAGVKVNNKDVFLNIAGGLKINDPAVDLAILACIISSHQDIAVSDKFCFAAEAGLSGEIRPVPYIDRRMKEAQAMGFEKIFLSKYNKDSVTEKYSIRPVFIAGINDLIEQLIK